MARTACTLNNITLVTVVNGSRYRGGIDNAGNELPDIQLDITDEPTQRTYFCHNCTRYFDGSDSFDEVKKHFGTFPVD